MLDAVSCYLLAERYKSEHGHLEMLQSERDADNGHAADNPEPDMQNGDFYSAAENPYDVHPDGETSGVVGSGDHFMPERP